MTRFIFKSLLVALLSFVVLSLPIRRVTADDKAEVRLAVLVVFDQLRYDYLEKWDKLYGEGGFKRFRKEGASFSNCNYPFAVTLTSPGHASLVTGTVPAKHGIMANRWFDAAIGKGVVEEESTVPPPEKEHLGEGPYRRRAQVETVGDVLLRLLGFRGRVVSLALKPRSAIMMAALRAQLCYWFETGQKDHPMGFRRSRYYSQGEPDPKWVRDFNSGPAKVADRWKGKSWERFKPFDYTPFSSIDNFLGEGLGYDQGGEFPHPFKEFKDKDAYKYYEAVTLSPMGNDLLWEFAKSAIEGEKLGQGDTVDLLTLGFSSSDLVGHCYGPDSQEVLDTTLRTDALMEQMIDYLDAKVGRGKYVLVLSSDHGVCPLTDYSQQFGKKKIDALPPDYLTGQLDKHLSDKFLSGKPAAWQKTKTTNPFLYLNGDTIHTAKLNRVLVAQAAADWLVQQPAIQAAYTRSQLIKHDAELDDVGKMVRRSFDPGSAVDVMFVLKPYHLMPIDLKKNETFRTTHGTPHAYDTHVPLLVLGPRVQPGLRSDPVTPQAAAAILAESLRLPPPNFAEYPVPTGLFTR